MIGNLRKDSKLNKKLTIALDDPFANMFMKAEDRN